MGRHGFQLVAIIAALVLAGCGAKNQQESASKPEYGPLPNEAIVSISEQTDPQSLKLLGLEVEEIAPAIGVYRVKASGLSWNQIRDLVQEQSPETVVEPNYQLQSPTLPAVGSRGTSMEPKHVVALTDSQDNVAPDLTRDPVPFPTDGTDPMRSEQWNLDFVNYQPPTREEFENLKKITVAVIDEGVDYNHEDLRDSMLINENEIPNNGIDDDNNGYIDDVIGYDFGDKDAYPYNNTRADGEMIGHGTHCAGVVGAITGNGKGIASIASGVKILAIKNFGKKADSTSDIKAIMYAADRGARIISASWGIGNPFSGGLYDINDGPVVAFKRALSYAKKKGSLFIAAAGNGTSSGPRNFDSSLEKNRIPLPVGLSNTMGVASIMEKGILSNFSDFGESSIEAAAPGEVILSTVPGSQYADGLSLKTTGFFGGEKQMTSPWSGTSMATPLVAGFAARLLARDLSMTPGQIFNEIQVHTKASEDLTGKVGFGGYISF